MQKPSVLALVGFPGSGKTRASDFFQQKGVIIIRMGIVTDKLLELEKKPVTENSEKTAREELRKKFGSNIYAVLITPKILSGLNKKKHICIDGMRFINEYEYFKEHIGIIKILYIHTETEIRHKRLLKRKIRSLTVIEAKQRDNDEINYFDTLKLKKFADYNITNNGTRQELTSKLNCIWKKEFRTI